jgi:hypothetical protein
MNKKKVLFVLVAILFFLAVALFWYNQKSQMNKLSGKGQVMYSEAAINEAANATADPNKREYVFTQEQFEAAAKKPAPVEEQKDLFYKK